ncbi:MAG: response regulator [Phycisphaerales bacterium JB037]
MSETKRIRYGSSARANTLGLDGRALDSLLEHLDQVGDGTKSKREFVRMEFRKKSLPLKLTQAQGQSVVLRVVCRNLSRGGMAVLHNAFVHPGTKCATVLNHARSGSTVITGEVVRCQHRGGTVHELGVRFDREIDVRAFVTIDPFSDSFSLERVNPEELKGCIVHAEESEMDRRLIQHFLRETQLRIRPAATQEEAFTLVQQGCDLLLSEYYLREGNGGELIRSLRESGDATPAIILTADASMTGRSDSLSIGADAFLNKPITQDLLLRSLGEYLLVDRESAKQRQQIVASSDTGKLAKEFAEQLRTIADELEERMHEDDATACRSICLKVHGLAPSLGFREIGELAEAAADALTATRSVSDSIQQLRQLRTACARAEAA